MKPDFPQAETPVGSCANAPQTAEQLLAWDHVRTVFGRRPSTIRSLSERVCVVSVQLSYHESYEVICADGLLVGIPPERPLAPD